MPSRLESLLELSLRTSSTNVDPFKDDLGLELFSYGLTAQMVRILSIQTQDERGNSLKNLRLHVAEFTLYTYIFFV